MYKKRNRLIFLIFFGSLFLVLPREGFCRELKDVRVVFPWKEPSDFIEKMIYKNTNEISYMRYVRFKYYDMQNLRIVWNVGNSIFNPFAWKEVVDTAKRLDEVGPYLPEEDTVLLRKVTEERSDWDEIISPWRYEVQYFQEGPNGELIPILEPSAHEQFVSLRSDQRETIRDALEKKVKEVAGRIKSEASFNKLKTELKDGTACEGFTTILANKIRNTDKDFVGTKSDEFQKAKDKEIGLQDSSQFETGSYEKVHNKTYGMQKKDSSSNAYTKNEIGTTKVTSFDPQFNKTQPISTIPNTFPQADYQKVYNDYLQQPPWQQVNRLGYIAFSSLSPYATSSSNLNADFTDLMNAVRSRDWDRVLAISEVLYNNGQLNELAVRTGYNPEDFNRIAGTGINSYHDLRNQYSKEEFNQIFEQSIRYIENTSYRE